MNGSSCVVCDERMRSGVPHKCSRQKLRRFLRWLCLSEERDVPPTFDDRLAAGFTLLSDEYDGRPVFD